MKRSYEIDMCNGPLLGKILQFSIPLICSGILQLLFNAADIVVVGQFTGSDALAAVGSTSALNNLIINVFLGFSIGCSIMTARYYGAQKWKDVHEVVHTSMLVSMICGAALIVIGIALARPLLEVMGTPENVLDQAVLYMRIIFVGMPALMVYNFGAAILRAVGDTKRPLLFLLIAGVINVVLNLVFVIVFHMGVAGVAVATVISQCVSAVMIVVCLMRSETVYQLCLKELRIYKDKLIEITKVGLPAGIQGAVFNVSNVLIQSSVNSFGSLVVAGNTAATNLEGFVYTSMNAIYQASLSFTSQNIGAGKMERIKPVLWRCLAVVFVVGAGMGGLGLLFMNQLLGIYSGEPEVISYGALRMELIFSTYFFCGMMDVACGSVRGLGYSITPTVISLTGACGLRILWIYTVFALDRSLFTLYLSYPVTWAVTFLGHLVCFFIFLRKVKRKAAWEIRPQGPEPSEKEERAEEIYNQRETNEEL